MPARTETGAALPLGFFRAALAVLLLQWLARAFVHYPLFFGREGLLSYALWRPTVVRGSWSFFLRDPSDAVGRGIVAVAVLAAVGLLLGIFPRTCAWICYGVLTSLQERTPLLMDGSDELMRVLLFPLLLVRSNARFSLQGARAGRVEALGLNVLQAQVALVYLTTALLKLPGKPWQDGTALGRVLQLENFARADWTVLASHPAWMAALTYFALAFELSFAFLVWFKPTRPWVLVCGVALHLGIDLLLYIPVFSWLMLASYLVFVPAEKLEAFLARLRRAGRRPAAPEAMLPAPTHVERCWPSTNVSRSSPPPPSPEKPSAGPSWG
jgi:hypothetical protein